MDTTKRTNAIDVLHFINQGTTRPCAMSGEFGPFWKACTEEEKEQFGQEARALMYNGGQPA